MIMKNELSEISARIRELREVCGYSQEKLAKELNIEKDIYVKYEEDGANIPISVIYEIANKFNVDFTEIVTGIGAKLDTYHIVKRGKGQSVSRYPGYRFEDLAFRYNKKVMQPLLVTLDPSDEPAGLVSHTGQEFNLILEGTVAVTFEGKELILNEGDSIYFNPTHKHGQKCVGNVKARFLTVITE
ncbi:MAG: cupin domain-containing protein [Oscillospiraceae bacterium]